MKNEEYEIEEWARNLFDMYYELYNEMIEEKGKEELDQHWAMVFADKIVKEFEKMINEAIIKTKNEVFLTKENKDKQKGRLNAYIKLKQKLK